MPRSFPGEFQHDAAVNSTYFSLCPMCGKKLGPGMVLWYTFANDTLYLHPQCGRNLLALLSKDIKPLEEPAAALPEPTVVDADPNT